MAITKSDNRAVLDLQGLTNFWTSAKKLGGVWTWTSTGQTVVYENVGATSGTACTYLYASGTLQCNSNSGESGTNVGLACESSP